MPSDALPMPNGKLDVKVHAATFALTRIRLSADVLHRKNLRPWFNKFLTRVDEFDKVLKLDEDAELATDPPVAFVQGVGPLERFVPRRITPPAFEIKYAHSKILAEPLYIPVNWTVSLKQDEALISPTFRLRVRLHTHGGYTVALYGQIRSEAGIAISRLASLLRSIEGTSTNEKLTFSVRNAANDFEALGPELLASVSDAVERGICSAPISESGGDDSLRLSPDFLIVDLGRCTPAIDVTTSDGVLARLLSLDLNPLRQIVHKRDPDLGLNTTDWVGLSSKRLLFCDTDKVWPHSGRLRRMSQHRGVVLWRLYSAVELTRMQKLLAGYLANRFELASLGMVRASNRSLDFLRTILKSNFYDDRLATLAADHSNVRGQLHGRDAQLYDELGKAILLGAEEKRLQEASKQFLTNVGTWKPGASKLLDLLKLIPMK